MTPKPPLAFLVDRFLYREYLDDNGDWGKARYKEPVAVEHCRIDRGEAYTSAATGKQLLYRGLIFCYQGLTTPLPDFKTQSLVEYDGRTYTITNVIPILEPYRSRLYSYELEVV